MKSLCKKIAIIGCPGSGKTMLSCELSKKYNLPLFHLDQYRWEPNCENKPLDDQEQSDVVVCQKKEIERFTEIHNNLCQKKEWIIEGVYIKNFFYRIHHADVVLFLDMPRWYCLWNVFKREIMYFGKTIPGGSKKCRYSIFKFKFLASIWNFKKEQKPQIMAILDQYKQAKQIFILKSFREIEDFLHSSN